MERQWSGGLPFAPHPPTPIQIQQASSSERLWTYLSARRSLLTRVARLALGSLRFGVKSKREVVKLGTGAATGEISHRVQ